MRKIRGFKLGKRVFSLFRRVIRRNRSPDGYLRLDPPTCKSKAITRICNWGRLLKTGAKTLCSIKSGSALGSGYVKVGHDQNDLKTVPKGHLAVYVGQEDGDYHRFLVPVIYFNHPLFGSLLREAEEAYGFSHPGGITIPCQISEFESVQTRIAAGKTCRKLTWKRS